ncbi:MAG: hypothetical protein OXG68_12195 [Chloroflexi bacterium]|nr:hypothetical protein [Chloroflexota bacterium]
MNVRRADDLMARLLLVNSSGTAVAVGDEETVKRGAENALTLSLVFSGARCILQYAALPFLLPIIGIASEATLPILLLINLVAMVSIFFSLRRFWSIGYAHRWRYLVVAAAALVLLVAFTIYDISKLGTA